jgi:hypothetical protein
MDGTLQNVSSFPKRAKKQSRGQLFEFALTKEGATPAAHGAAHNHPT